MKTRKYVYMRENLLEYFLAKWLEGFFRARALWVKLENKSSSDDEWVAISSWERDEGVSGWGILPDSLLNEQGLLAPANAALVLVLLREIRLLCPTWLVFTVALTLLLWNLGGPISKESVCGEDICFFLLLFFSLTRTGVSSLSLSDNRPSFWPSGGIRRFDWLELMMQICGTMKQK